MIDVGAVSRAFVRYSGPRLLSIIHKAENDIYERLGEITMEDDAERAYELAEDVDHLVFAINVHLGVALGRNTASLRGSGLSPDLFQSATNCSFSPHTVSELMSILASLYSVLLDVAIGFSRSETECTNRLRGLVQRILSTFSHSHNLPRLSVSSSDSSAPLKLPVSADIRLLDVIAQAERITSLRNTATLLPLFDFALLSVKRLYSTSLNTHKKSLPEDNEDDKKDCDDSVAVLLKAIIVVRIAKRIFSRHALRHLRALHTSNGASFPHVGMPLLTAISSSPYASELPESAHASVDELRSFLLDSTACPDELMERILCYLTRSSNAATTELETEKGDDAEPFAAAENDDFFCQKQQPLEPLAESIQDNNDNIDDRPAEKRRKLSVRKANESESSPFESVDRQTSSDNDSSSRRTNQQNSSNRSSSADLLQEVHDVLDYNEEDPELVVVGDDSDDDDKSDQINDNDDDEEDDIPLDQLRAKRPKSVDSTLSASWASVSFETSSAPSPCSTANGSGTDADAANSSSRRRSARLSSKGNNPSK